MSKHLSAVNLIPVRPPTRRSANRAISDLLRYKYRLSYAAELLIKEGKFYDGRPAYQDSGEDEWTPTVFKTEISEGLTLRHVDASARAIGLREPTVEFATLLREQLSDSHIASMGLRRLIVMHTPAKNPDGTENLLGLGIEVGGKWLHAYSSDPSTIVTKGTGFVYLDSLIHPKFED